MPENKSPIPPVESPVTEEKEEKEEKPDEKEEHYENMVDEAIRQSMGDTDEPI